MPSRKQFKTQEEYNQWYRDYRNKNREKVRAYNREYNKIYRKINGWENEKKWKEKNQVKVNVERILQRAIRRGEMKRLPCAICGKKETHAHHSDYKEPLKVIFLCPLHHKQLHLGKKVIPS